jgi:gamma-glutamyltranspeptidase
VIDFGLSPAEAVTVPRFATTHHQDSFNPNPARERTILKHQSLDVYESIDQDVLSDLAARGHIIGRWKEPIGHPVMLMIEDGTMLAAGDPDAERHAAGMT